MKRVDDLTPDELRKIIRRWLKEAEPDQLREVIRNLGLEARGPGRSPIYQTGGRLMQIWIAIEIQRYKGKHKSLASTIESLFNQVRGARNDPDLDDYNQKLYFSSLWLANVGDKDELEIKTENIKAKTKSLARLYYQARELIRGDPKLRKRWMHNLKLAKRLIDHPEYSTKLIDWAKRTFPKEPLTGSLSD